MNTDQRFHALDAVRAFALIGGILLHGTMSYLPGLQELRWPISDRSPSMTLEVLFYVIHIFRMTVFYFIAGFFAHLLFHRKGLTAFRKDRVRRIVVPFSASMLVIMPLTVAPIIWGAVKMAGGNPPPQGPPPPGIPLVHLWFLYYLLMIYVIVIAARGLIVRFDSSGSLRAAADRAMRYLVSGYAAPFVFAVPTMAALYFTDPWPWIGIPTPEFAPIPKLPALIAYGTAFAYGWLLHRQTDLLATFEKQWVFHLVLALVATAGSWYIAGAPLSFVAPVPADAKLLYAVVYMIATWTWVFAIVGAALKFFSAASPVRRYLADSSYWMYLIHLPVIFALQVVMMQWELHWAVKYPLLMTLTFALLLLSYHYLVRNTFIGEWLNGRRIPRKSDSVPPAAAQPG